MSKASAYFLFLILSPLVVLTLAGCESFWNMRAWPPPFSVSAGSMISINKELEINPNEVTVWLQNGQVMERRYIKVRQPNCRFEIYTIKNIIQIIHKDEVEIIKFVHDKEYVSNKAKIVASLLSNQESASPTAEVYMTEIYLKSKKQPDLFRLICEHWEAPSEGTYLTMNQIQNTLGEIATIKEM